MRILAGTFGCLLGAIGCAALGIAVGFGFALLQEDTPRNPGAAAALMMLIGTVPVGFAFGAFYGAKAGLKLYDRTN